MDKLQQDFQRQGYVVAESAALRERVVALKSSYESDFKWRFGDDPVTNRNLIKRFADSIELAALFTSPELVELVRVLGIAAPVYCGPIVSHYTHHDTTGNSYGLPWHQDHPSMASSSNALIAWFSVNDCSVETHSVQVAPGLHTQGVLEGEQTEKGYILADQEFAEQVVLDIKAGDVLLFSPYLPHRTYVNSASVAYKLSFSRRFDDLACPEWAVKKFVNAYQTQVDRMLYLSKSNTRKLN